MPRATRPTRRRTRPRTSPSPDRTRRPVHVDLIELHLQGKQAHWNIVGKNFRDLHLQLDEVVDAAREFSDEITERLEQLAWMMRAKNRSPDTSAPQPIRE